MMSGVSLLTLMLAWQGSADCDPQRVTWRQLEFKGSLLVWAVTAVLELDRAPAKPEEVPVLANKQLITVTNPFKLTLQTKAGGTRSLVWSWFDPHSGRAAIGRKLSQGRQNLRKWYRYTLGDATVQRLGPMNKSQKKDINLWSKQEQFTYTWPFPADQQPPVTDATTLFYLASASNLNAPGDQLATYVFAGKALLKVTMILDSIQALETHYSLNDVSREKKQDQVLKIRLEAARTDGMGGKSEFDLLGLEEDIVLFLDRSTRLPVRIMGKAPFFGTVEINLNAAHTMEPGVSAGPKQ